MLPLSVEIALIVVLLIAVAVTLYCFNLWTAGRQDLYAAHRRCKTYHAQVERQISQLEDELQRVNMRLRLYEPAEPSVVGNWFAITDEAAALKLSTGKYGVLLASGKTPIDPESPTYQLQIFHDAGGHLVYWDNETGGITPVTKLAGAAMRFVQ
jgi:hypothetical protein